MTVSPSAAAIKMSEDQGSDTTVYGPQLLGTSLVMEKLREMINRVRRAIVMSEGRQISARDLELGEYVEVAPVSLAQAREAAERQAIELALLRHRGRLGDAAQELGISRVTLYRLLSAHGMRHIEVDAPTEHVTRG